MHLTSAEHSPELEASHLLDLVPGYGIAPVLPPALVLGCFLFNICQLPEMPATSTSGCQCQHSQVAVAQHDIAHGQDNLLLDHWQVLAQPGVGIAAASRLAHRARQLHPEKFHT